MQSALEGGARLLQLREKNSHENEQRVLATGAQKLCEQFGATLVVNSHLEIAREIGCGAHFPERQIAQIEYSKLAFCGVSVHSVESALRAEKSGANYLVFGAVFPTSSHPNEAAQGVEKLRDVTNSVSVPVYAIGGIDDEKRVAECLGNGAFGVAVRSAVWESDDVAQSVARFRFWCGDS